MLEMDLMDFPFIIIVVVIIFARKVSFKWAKVYTTRQVPEDAYKLLDRIYVYQWNYINLLVCCDRRIVAVDRVGQHCWVFGIETGGTIKNCPSMTCRERFDDCAPYCLIPPRYFHPFRPISHQEFSNPVSDNLASMFFPETSSSYKYKDIYKFI